MLHIRSVRGSVSDLEHFPLLCISELAHSCPGTGTSHSMKEASNNAAHSIASSQQHTGWGTKKAIGQQVNWSGRMVLKSL